ncbi:MAG TPA: trypsin-like peptidase domain-containing protein [Allosphingosinicella sp.]|jgi:hypothetical protein|nr:trypsin-like peptidase domain-containing protein [Allosphingosinicella sp.]
MSTDSQSRDVESRLRRTFGDGDYTGYSAEGDFGACEGTRESRHANRTDRITAAVGQLADLIEETAPDGTSLPALHRAQDHVELAREIARSLIEEKPLPAKSQVPFVAELMIISDGTRPATMIRNGSVAEPAALGAFGELYSAFLFDAGSSIAATGRLELDGRHVGSGVLVAHPQAGVAAILTARHAAIALEGGRLNGAVAHIDFSGEFRGARANRHVLASPAALGASEAAEEDWAVLRLSGAADPGAVLPAPAAVDRRRDAFEPPRQLAVVSYPGRPPDLELLRAQSAAWDRLFRGVWHVKRLSPARAVGFGDPRDLVLHDATTTRGSSGGAMLSVGTGKVGGIHCGSPAPGANWGLSIALIAARGGW